MNNKTETRLCPFRITVASGWKNRKSCDIISPSSETARKPLRYQLFNFGSDKLQNRSHL